MFVKEAKGLPEPDAEAILVPEVQITIGTDKGDGEPQSAMTTRGTSGPGSTVWNQNFDFTLEESSEVILLKVVDTGSGGATTLGEVALPLSQVVTSPGSRLEKVWDLKDKRGNGQDWHGKLSMRLVWQANQEDSTSPASSPKSPSRFAHLQRSRSALTSQSLSSPSGDRSASREPMSPKSQRMLEEAKAEAKAVIQESQKKRQDKAKGDPESPSRKTVDGQIERAMARRKKAEDAKAAAAAPPLNPSSAAEPNVATSSVERMAATQARLAAANKSAADVEAQIDAAAQRTSPQVTSATEKPPASTDTGAASNLYREYAREARAHGRATGVSHQESQGEESAQLPAEDVAEDAVEELEEDISL